MALDALTSLAFSLHAAPGTYAVLLGSGVSSAAGIPTGWAIVLDLIRRLAAASGADAGSDPEAWYLEQFGSVPEYSALLDALAHTQAERQALLRPYIEPTQEHLASGLRVPTAAHRAIASLVAAGYLRVVVTTNFDRLVEQALDDQGASYDVIASVDSLSGARPLAQSPCTVVKLHGDYRDARIRNTPIELESYDPAIEQLLDRVLDEHGLIVCGWSATWDTALRAAIERQPNRRYSTYWVAHGAVSDDASRLIAHRGAQVIDGRGADEFFTELEGKLAGLADVDRPHPLTVATAVAELKRYLPDPKARIRLEDLVLGEAERVVEAISDSNFPVDAGGSIEDARRRIRRYQAAVEVFVALIATGCTYGDTDDHDRLWGRALERVAEHEGSQSGLTAYIALRRYPALLGLYAGGIAAVHAGRWGALKQLMVDAQSHDAIAGSMPIATALYPHNAFSNIDPQTLLHPDHSGGRMYTPVSDHLHGLLRDFLRPLIPSDRRYTVAFDGFEFLLGMVLFDLHEHPVSAAWTPKGFVGAFGWRFRHQQGAGPAPWIAQELADHGAACGLLRAGLFGADAARADQARQAIETQQQNREWW